MSVGLREESIHQFINRHSSTDIEGMTVLGSRWIKLCEKMDVDINYVRRKMDHWFLEVYNSRNRLLDSVIDTTGKVQTRKEALYWRFFTDFDKILEIEDGIQAIQMQAARHKLEKKYSTRFGDLVDLAVRCVTAEFELQDDFLNQHRSKDTSPVSDS